ncbi:MAG: DUF2797 domain-containing protein [Oscillospiraceae bacterium]|nr:DUF2797 domain-containing protein [Oscillospiraceae bacterium]
MARYIRVFLDADNLRIELAKLCERFNILFGEESQGFGKALSELPETIPAADVRPERHGHWIEYDGYQVCSECGEEHAWDSYRATYCEDCGAKMDGKDV